MNLKVEDSFKSTLDKLSSFDKNVVDKTNKVANKAKSKMIKFGADNYEISTDDISETINYRKADITRSIAKLNIRGSRLSMRRFKVKANKTSPLQVGVKKGSLKPLLRGFLQKGNNGKEVVFKRIYGIRTPIAAVRSLSVPQMLGSDKAKSVFEKTVSESLKKEISSDLDKLLKGD